MSFIRALAGGFAGTLVIVLTMIIARGIGLSDMNYGYILGSYFTGDVSDAAWVYGFSLLTFGGVLIGFAYALIFEAMRRADWKLGLIIGAGQCVLAGVLLAATPLLHPELSDITSLSNPGFLGINHGIITPVLLVLLQLAFGAWMGRIYKLNHPRETPEAEARPAHA